MIVQLFQSSLWLIPVTFATRQGHTNNSLAGIPGRQCPNAHHTAENTSQEQSVQVVTISQNFQWHRDFPAVFSHRLPVSFWCTFSIVTKQACGPQWLMRARNPASSSPFVAPNHKWQINNAVAIKPYCRMDGTNSTAASIWLSTSFFQFLHH